jgi:hypothetical protein
MWLTQASVGSEFHSYRVSCRLVTQGGRRSGPLSLSAVCKAARDRNSPATAYQINSRRSLIAVIIDRFAGDRQLFWVYGRYTAAFMIGHHFSASAFCRTASASEVCCLRGKISIPNSEIRDRTCGIECVSRAEVPWLQLEQSLGNASRTGLRNYRTGLGIRDLKRKILQNRIDAFIKLASPLEPRRICMIMSYSQIASSCPKPMLDARVAL